MSAFRNIRRNTDDAPTILLGAGAIGKNSSFRLVSNTATEPETISNIRDFREFKRLRKVYHNLCELPETLFEDWIACCMDHIAKDIHGNTPEENAHNVRIGTLYANFHDEYMTILNSGDAPDVRKKHLDEALLSLLRSLLGRPCRLADQLITLTGFPTEP
jgi:hypothetical protein